MDKILITGLLIVAAVTAAGVLFATIGPAIQRGGESVSSSITKDSERLQTNLQIISVMPNNLGEAQLGLVVDAWVKNTGSTDIRPISMLDVFLLRSDGAWGDYIAYYALGGQNPAGGASWSTVPADLSNWVPGASLHIKLCMFQKELSAGNYDLAVTTPNGVIDEHLFEFSPLDLPPEPSCWP